MEIELENLGIKFINSSTNFILINLSYNVVAPIRNFNSKKKISHKNLNLLDLENAEKTNNYFENFGKRVININNVKLEKMENE